MHTHVIVDMDTAEVEYFTGIVAALRAFGWRNNAVRRTGRFVLEQIS